MPDTGTVTLPDDVRELARGRTLAVLTTVQPDGQPQSSVVWPHADAHHLLVGTNTTRRKYLNVVADPRVTLVLLTADGGYVEVRGRVVGVEGGDAALDLAATTFTKWTGSPELYPAPGERVLLRVAPDRIHRRI